MHVFVWRIAFELSALTYFRCNSLCGQPARRWLSTGGSNAFRDQVWGDEKATPDDKDEDLFTDLHGSGEPVDDDFDPDSAPINVLTSVEQYTELVKVCCPGRLQRCNSRHASTTVWRQLCHPLHRALEPRVRVLHSVILPRQPKSRLQYQGYLSLHHRLASATTHFAPWRMGFQVSFNAVDITQHTDIAAAAGSCQRHCCQPRLTQPFVLAFPLATTSTRPSLNARAQASPRCLRSASGWGTMLGTSTRGQTPSDSCVW